MRLPGNLRRAPLLRNEILQVILALCEGIFLIAAFQVNFLGNLINPGEVREALRTLPAKFPNVYDDTMNRIEKDEFNSDVAFRILSFILHARRPLTVRELQHFLAVMPDHRDLCDEYITDINILLSLCEGMVVVDDNNATSAVRLVHPTALEYLKNQTLRFSQGNRDMGHTCLVYLSFDPFKNISNLPRTLLRYTLLEYIVHHWNIHISDYQQALKAPLYAFFNDDALLRAYSCFMYSHRPDYFKHDQRRKGMRQNYAHTGLHAASAAGLILVAKWLIADNPNVDHQDATGGTAIMYASRGGHVEMVDFLITKSPNVGTALYMAAYEGHNKVISLLLQHTGDPDVLSGYKRIALKAAVDRGHKIVVELLENHRARLDSIED